MNDDEVKRCSKCWRYLPLTDFDEDGRTRDRLTYRCRACRTEHGPYGDDKKSIAMATREQIIGTFAVGGFLASIPFANWWLTQHGFWDAPFLGPVPSALWVVAISFLLRDVAQIALGRTWAWIAILIGTALSWWLASPTLAIASCVAFAVSESIDGLIFTPLADRGRFLLGVTISGYAAGFVDSALFICIAFDTWYGWWQLGIAKAAVVVIATPFAWMFRHALLRKPGQ